MSAIKLQTKTAGHVDNNYPYVPGGVTLSPLPSSFPMFQAPFGWYQYGAYPVQTQGDGNYMTTDTLTEEPQAYYSAFMIATNFDFNIPSRAQVIGVKVRLYVTCGDTYDVNARLMIDRNIGAENKASGTPMTSGYIQYGNESDLWEESLLTASKINDNEFGFAFSVFNDKTLDFPFSTATCRVDLVEITVYYDDSYTEVDEVAIEQTGQCQKQLYAKVYDSTYTYLGTLNGDDFSDTLAFTHNETGFGAVSLQANFTYLDFIQSDRLTSLIRSGNIIDIFISDRDVLNKLMYSGFIDGYTTRLDKSGINTLMINVIPHSAVLSARILRDDDLMLIDYESVDPADIAKDILNKSNTFITWTDDTIPTEVGVSRSYEFNCATTKEALDKVVELCPDWWIGFVDRNNNYNLKYMYEAPVHTITKNMIASLETNISMLNLRNSVLFLGGGDPALYYKFHDFGSEEVYGLFEKKMIDERVTVGETAKVLAGKYLAQNSAPAITITVTLADNNFSNDGNGVDIEKFEIGDKIMLVDDNYNNAGSIWGEFIWGVDYWGEKYMAMYGKEAYITGYTYNFGSITLSCTFHPVQTQKRIEDINRDISASRFENAPNYIKEVDNWAIPL